MSRQTTGAFDGGTPSRGEPRVPREQAPLRARQHMVLEQIEGSTIVDIGCYTGGFVREASRQFPDRTVIGIDFEDNNIRVARELNPGLAGRLHRMSAYNLEFADASIDCATMQEVLEHLEGAAVAVKEVNRVLRPGGVLIVTVPNPYYIGRVARFCLSELANAWRRWRGLAPRLQPEVLDPATPWDRHVAGWTPATLLALLGSNGFDYVRHDYENGMPSAFRRAVLAALPFLGPTLILKVRKIAPAPRDLV